MKDWYDIIAAEAEVSPVAFLYGWDAYRNRVAETGLMDDIDLAIEFAIGVAEDIDHWVREIKADYKDDITEIIDECLTTWYDWVDDDTEITKDGLADYVAHMMKEVE